MLMGVTSRRVKELARQAGFDLAGIASVEPFERERQALADRIDGGLFDGLPWFTRDRAAIASDPRSLLPEARSIVSLGLSYDTGEGPAGLVARYAWGQDYHDVIRGRLKDLQRRLEEEAGEFEFRTFVDTGRIVDRAAAVRAGLGWYGKNTNVLNTSLGSWFFLAELVTTLELEPDQPTRQNCGQCRACIDVCPTGAIVAPYVVDNNRCISFLTIELRGPIPRDLRHKMGSWIFGCDLCQDVCPVNAQAHPIYHPEFAPSPIPSQRETFLIELLRLTDDQFRERFRHTPVMRAKRRGLLRNVCVALGNSGDTSTISALSAALQHDPEPLVRGHAAWALGRLGAASELAAAQRIETDPYVQEEIELAHAAL
jgi:epoxyqueuosine reductase